MTTTQRTSDRTHDVVLYGATGFTGGLVAEHLVERARTGESFRLALAGRDPAKLAAVAEAVGAPDLPLLVASSGDPASLAAMAASANVVVSTVGPFSLHGAGVVAACVEAGTDYVDSTGEVQFVRAMIDRHQDAAVASGARLVSCCGFDSVPSDMGTRFAQETMHALHGVYARRVDMRLKAARGAASGGTLASMIQLLEDSARDPAVKAVLADPYALNPSGDRVGPHAPDRTTPELDEGFGAWVAPFVMELVNARVVRRSNAVQGYPYGREFLYGEGVLTGTGPAGRAAATAIAAGGLLGQLGMGSAPVRRLAGMVLPSSGSGPKPAAREKGYFDVRFLAHHPDDREKDVRVRVTADRDPGYGATARMVGEAALTLAMGESAVGGGFWTPASALGQPYQDRLVAHGGFTFDVL